MTAHSTFLPKPMSDERLSYHPSDGSGCTPSLSWFKQKRDFITLSRNSGKSTDRLQEWLDPGAQCYYHPTASSLLLLSFILPKSTYWSHPFVPSLLLFPQIILLLSLFSYSTTSSVLYWKFTQIGSVALWLAAQIIGSSTSLSKLSTSLCLICKTRIIKRIFRKDLIVLLWELSELKESKCKSMGFYTLNVGSRARHKFHICALICRSSSILCEVLLN